MSNEELIGKFGEQFRKAKEKLAACRSEALIYAQVLSKLSGFLEVQTGQPSIDKDGYAALLKDYPPKDVLEKLLNDLASLSEEMEVAKRELNRLGLQVQ